MKKTQAAVIVFSAALSAGLAMPAYAGQWEKKEEGISSWRYREDDGSYVVNSWKEIDGNWYYFDGTGCMVIGSYLINGRTERFDGQGVWIENPSEEAVISRYTVENDDGPGPGGSNWRQDDTGWYYQNFDGSFLKDGWQKIDGVWYYFDSQGYMMEDAWIDTDGKRYRVGTDGGMLTGQTITVDGIQYVLGEDGAVTDTIQEKTEEELQAEAIAAQIVASITTPAMTKPQKASAIYNYVRGNMTYTSGGLRPESGEAAAALYGFRRHSGNCFEYYAMSKYLLEAAGMPNMRVVRASDGDHFWNLVNVDGAWYHFDTTPRRTGGRWCLVTTGQLQAGSWGAHNFDVSAYPKTP